MNEQTAPEILSVGSIPPKWYWLASIFGLVWNLADLVAFAGQLTLDLSSLPAAERAFHEAMPFWATGAFAAAVSGGVLGAVALLLRRRWAFLLFVVSVLGIVVQVSHSLFVGDGIEVFGPSGFILPLLTFIIAIALAAFVRHSAERGWLK